jgi:chemotaxis protein histidine kinase CheA
MSNDYTLNNDGIELLISKQASGFWISFRDISGGAQPERDELLLFLNNVFVIVENENNLNIDLAFNTLYKTLLTTGVHENVIPKLIDIYEDGMNGWKYINGGDDVDMDDYDITMQIVEEELLLRSKRQGGGYSGNGNRKKYDSKLKQQGPYPRIGNYYETPDLPLRSKRQGGDYGSENITQEQSYIQEQQRRERRKAEQQQQKERQKVEQQQQREDKIRRQQQRQRRQEEQQRQEQQRQEEQRREEQRREQQQRQEEQRQEEQRREQQRQEQQRQEQQRREEQRRQEQRREQQQRREEQQRRQEEQRQAQQKSPEQQREMGRLFNVYKQVGIIGFDMNNLNTRQYNTALGVVGATNDTNIKVIKKKLRMLQSKLVHPDKCLNEGNFPGETEFCKEMFSMLSNAVEYIEKYRSRSYYFGFKRKSKKKSKKQDNKRKSKRKSKKKSKKQKEDRKKLELYSAISMRYAINGGSGRSIKKNKKDEERFSI